MTDYGHAKALLHMIDRREEKAREYDDAAWLIEQHHDADYCEERGWLERADEGHLKLTTKGRAEMKRKREWRTGRFRR